MRWPLIIIPQDAIPRTAETKTTSTTLGVSAGIKDSAHSTGSDGPPATLPASFMVALSFPGGKGVKKAGQWLHEPET